MHVWVDGGAYVCVCMYVCKYVWGCVYVSVGWSAVIWQGGREGGVTIIVEVIVCMYV